eukprot:TRINITY_DN453_c0_g1_i3.p1 TRINITY_DN453_c0_g1~~TRINITY_DN453_c0_g1_i3.p1  ORF type:complete len:612 (-),score=183.25 TRINITY_DN453_c0_g1_i3:94-1887(-)
MAGRLILVSFVLLSISLAWAQQSDETGGSDRRISLRRFSSRKKVENSRNVGRVKASADILEKRKQLFQRNPTRRRNFGKTESVSKTVERVRTTTEAYFEVEHPVENISNNDKEIRDLVLDNDKQEDKVEKPFSGVSEVRTVSSPSGFRSSNEQIVRVSFKKTTTEPSLVTTDIINQIRQEEETTQKPRQNPSVKLAPRRRLGIRRRGQKPENDSRRVTIAPVTERRFKDQVSSDPLKALLKTASGNSGTTEDLEPVDIEAAIREMKEDNMIDKPVDIEAAIREMKEDNRIEKPKSRSRGNSPRRLLTGRAQINVRGRNGQRQPTQQVPAMKEPRPSFRSFPARKGIQTGTASQAKATTTRPAPRQRFETRPTVSPTQLEFATTQTFQGFDFNTPSNQQNQFNFITEAPRSAFQLDQNFRRNNQNVITDQPTINNPTPIQPSQHFIQTPQVSQPSVPLQPSAPLQPQPIPQTPQIPIQRQQFPNRAQQVLPQNSFNLLNTNNFQAFDAQFGGSVPTNPGASQLASSIFARPQTALLQGRDVLVNTQNGFQGQVFQPAGRTSQQAVPQFSNQNIQPASFSGHPASDINLQTGAFNLRTG